MSLPDKAEWAVPIETEVHTMASSDIPIHYESVNNGWLYTGIPGTRHPDGWIAGLKDSLIHYFPRYKLKTSGTVAVDERPNTLQTVAFGLQHALAMFSGTVFIPMQMGFDANTTLFFSGFATIIFFILTGGRVPGYLGSSGSVISAVCAVTGFNSATSTTGVNENIPVAQGGIIVLALAYVGISFLVLIFGFKWVEFFMPPIVTGAVVASIGVHLAYSALMQATATPFDFYMGMITVILIMLISVYAPLPSIRRIGILLGLILGYVIHIICGVAGAGYPVDFSEVKSIEWVRGPIISGPIVFETKAISTIAPLVIVLVAENMGHIKATASLTGTPLERYLGRAYLADALSTLMAGCVGSSPLTTYSENIGVLSVTRVFSPLVILVAAFIAIILGFIAKFGAVVRSIPKGVFGGTTFVLYSLIAITGFRIWVVNRIDFTDSRNVFVGGLPLCLAAAMTTVSLQINDFQLDATGVSCFSAMILYQVLRGVDGFKEYYRWIKYQHQKYQAKKESSKTSAAVVAGNDS
ncbi:permease family-domain-containing protein [Dichotomocladium elegans]|nr:permease family-domain-containing protein [Dichotomocladium elegans]